jgi:hypothetical protein
MSLIVRIKEKISLRETARMLGIAGVPDRDGVKFASPLRADANPSCTVWKDRLVDWSRGKQQFDCIDLYAYVKNVSANTAVRELAAILGIDRDRPDGESSGGRGVRESWPLFAPGTKADAEALSESRGFSVEGMRLARDRGLLVFARACGFNAWVITDKTRLLAQARRLDGKWFPAFNHVAARKSHTFKGSIQSHVLGSADLAGYDFVLLVEGGPDIIAAHCFIAAAHSESERGRYGVVGVLGAANSLPAKVVKALRGKRVRIFGHRDPAGFEAASRWRAALQAKEIKSDLFSFRAANGDSDEISDLNDLLNNQCHPDRKWVTQFEVHP